MFNTGRREMKNHPNQKKKIRSPRNDRQAKRANRMMAPTRQENLAFQKDWGIGVQ